MASKDISPLFALAGIRSTLIFLFVVSGLVNILALTGSFYMMQVYDRTLASQSLSTLMAISVLALGLYVFQGMLDVLRSQVLVRIGARLDGMFAPLAHRVTIDMPRYGFSTTEAIERGRDVDTVRSFLGGQGPIALFDLPWLPIYLLFAYLLHPWLGVMVFAGALVLASLTLWTEILTRNVAGKVHESAIARQTMADAHARNADVLRAMGFAGRAIERYRQLNLEHLALQTRSNDVIGTLSSMSKVLRTVLQSAVLGFGAYLAIKGEMSAGAIIAASIIAGRALAPVDQAIGQWKGIVAARRSYKRLKDTLSTIPEAAVGVVLPRPSQKLTLEKVTVATPSNGTVVVSDVSFELTAGQALGLIGPTGGGKSSLAKAITGVWPPVRGAIRLDGAEIDHWPADDLGQHLGYMPQDVCLFEGTVAENISRFSASLDSQAITAAANAAGVHDLIMRLPDGYRTQIGPNGANLSAGQRQRIGLARALYGEPFLVVLDEPNSNLDVEGDAALTAAIKGVRERGGAVIVVAHRPSALAACDMVGVIQAGKLAMYGTKDEILPRQSGPARNTVAGAANATTAPTLRAGV